MAQSSEIYNQIQSLLGQVNPMLEQLPGAEQFYKDATNKAFNYNLGPLQNAAQLESKMYSMPGNLMSQYDTEFGGKTGISSNQRINSILSQLGNQAGLVDVARGLADQGGTRINDLAKTLLGQYQTGIQAKQQQLSPLMSIWDRMYSEEQANARAARAGSGTGGNAPSPLLTSAEIQAEIDRRLAETNKKTTSNIPTPVYTPSKTPRVTSWGNSLINKFLPKSSGGGVAGGGGGSW